VRGRSGDRTHTFTYTYNRDQLPDYDFVPRLWATRQIGYLLDRVRTQGETAALVADIRGLGLTYGLVTPYTTFLIAPQADGAASAANMSLYAADNQAALNQVSGQITVEARMQNQLYQQAAQANVASGANVVNAGQNSLVQVGTQNVDVALLAGQAAAEAVMSPEWIAGNITADRTVEFGSDEYYALAQDPAARLFLQTGRSVIFRYEGEVIAVVDGETP